MGSIGGPCSSIRKNKSEKVSKKMECPFWGRKTKVVRTEILHILVPIPSRGDPYLTVSRTFEFLPNPRDRQFRSHGRPPGMPVATGWKSGQNHDPDCGFSLKSIARKVDIGRFLIFYRLGVRPCHLRKETRFQIFHFLFGTRC